jgi:hypothetical protein
MEKQRETSEGNYLTSIPFIDAYNYPKGEMVGEDSKELFLVGKDANGDKVTLLIHLNEYKYLKSFFEPKQIAKQIT